MASRETDEHRFEERLAWTMTPGEGAPYVFASRRRQYAPRPATHVILEPDTSRANSTGYLDALTTLTICHTISLDSKYLMW
jgi:hypothetical protein